MAAAISSSCSTFALAVGTPQKILTAGRRHFVVDDKFVRVISHREKSTCFSVATDSDIPRAEVVASALLQLKNNPGLFKKWRKRRGYAFKANGKMFRDTEWFLL
jgi:hypothetical protein